MNRIEQMKMAISYKDETAKSALRLKESKVVQITELVYEISGQFLQKPYMYQIDIGDKRQAFCEVVGWNAMFYEEQSLTID